MRRAYVVGGGLAGLVAAERLSAAGRAVTVLEASPKLGGRCRSYRDPQLGRVIDNGNHLILSANRAVLAWAGRVGSGDALRTDDAAFPFLDLADGRRWTIRLGRGPFGALRPGARPPGVGAGALAADVARLMLAGRRDTVAQAVPRGAAWRPFWDPMTRAVLNEAPERGSARLLRAALVRSFARGASAAGPVFAPAGLGAALVDPAEAVLRARGARLHLRTPVRGLRMPGRRVTGIDAGGRIWPVSEDDVVILALPARRMATLLPDLDLPGAGRAILNAHFVVPDSGLPPLLALLGGDAHWVFRRGDVVSVTVSAEEDSPLAGRPRDEALRRLWGDVRRAVLAHGGRVPDGVPPARLLRERAATFDQTPAGDRRRHPARTRWRNLLLAGDHVATGLPATLEGAVLSGEAAAALALRQGPGPAAVEHRVPPHEVQQ